MDHSKITQPLPREVLWKSLLTDEPNFKSKYTSDDRRTLSFLPSATADEHRYVFATDSPLEFQGEVQEGAVTACVFEIAAELFNRVAQQKTAAYRGGYVIRPDQKHALGTATMRCSAMVPRAVAQVVFANASYLNEIFFSRHLARVEESERDYQICIKRFFHSIVAQWLVHDGLFSTRFYRPSRLYVYQTRPAGGVTATSPDNALQSDGHCNDAVARVYPRDGSWVALVMEWEVREDALDSPLRADLDWSEEHLVATAYSCAVQLIEQCPTVNFQIPWKPLYRKQERMEREAYKRIIREYRAYISDNNEQLGGCGFFPLESMDEQLYTAKNCISFSAAVINLAREENPCRRFFFLPSNKHRSDRVLETLHMAAHSAYAEKAVTGKRSAHVTEVAPDAMEVA